MGAAACHDVPFAAFSEEENGTPLCGEWQPKIEIVAVHAHNSFPLSATVPIGQASTMRMWNAKGR
ncbi:MAG: hypothetical protein DRO73_09285 [Candidatus Thorarchaeota archaeon]|nr:MAG: hypothetical protein DRO73_09285 [Candidatus Thorarchaeota archaeon]RLI59125.1 MAG: hypothetical protein DRO93_08805 [Candidatus Thorarchaeota archaeon]